MTELKAIEWQNAFRRTCKGGLMEGETNQACNMAVVALEKKIPKKIILNSEDDRENEDYICPNCKDILQKHRKGATRITIYKYKFCHRCGQALDWSEE